MANAGNSLLIMEAANLFAGKKPDDVNASNHLSLSDVKLPNWEESYVDHRAGGAPVAIEIDTVWNRLQCDFTLAGWTPQVAALLNSWIADEKWFYLFGLIRDRATGTAQQAMAVMQGKLGKADPQNWQRGNLQHWSYSIRGVVHYELFFDSQANPMYFWDFFTNTFVVDGVDRNAELNAALNLMPTLQQA